MQEIIISNKTEEKITMLVEYGNIIECYREKGKILLFK